MTTSNELPSSGAIPTDCEVALARNQIEFARSYTKRLLADIDPDDWFQMPSGSQTHLAWQVGHLAMAEYGLTLLRIRGKEPSDKEFITNDFIRKFKRGSTPDADAAHYPAVDEILTVFDAVHGHAMKEMESYTADQLNESLPMPVAVYENKLGSLLFCASHEMIHAGQIGFLRRLLGKEPLG